MAQVWTLSPNEARTYDEERRNQAEEAYLESLRSSQTAPAPTPSAPVPVRTMPEEPPEWTTVRGPSRLTPLSEGPSDEPREIKVTTGGSGFNPIALLIVAVGGLVVYVGVKGTWRNVLALFQPTQPSAQTPGGVQCTPGKCPPGFCSIDTVNGPKCVPMKV